MDWKETEAAWLDFQEDVRVARASLGVTYAGAWFRGQKHSWDLNPRIIRQLIDLEARISELRDERRKQKKHVVACRRFASKNNLKDDDRVVKEERKLANLDRQIAAYAKRVSTSDHIHGEGRAFVEYRFRSGVNHDSSWQTLAEMQHYGVPTRLLDWTESFGVALAFALEEHIRVIDEIWKEDRKSWRTQSREKLLSYNDVDVSIDGIPTEPTIWIMNPYRLAQEATGEPALWDYTLSAADDYFEAFVNNSTDSTHKFAKPVPMLSPWRDDRIAAQEGMFTFHGRSRAPLNHIYNERTVTQIRIGREVAVHGVRFLYEFFGINRFSMFRDKDSLGQEVTREFFS